MKVAVAGKGGVGKTTVTALLAHVLARRGREVWAIDADPAPCLGAALGFPAELLASLRPVAEMRELVEERTGAIAGGGLVRLNPTVDDIPARFSAAHAGVRLLELGSVQEGGGGCICPESAVLRALVSRLLLEPGQVVLLDMYAGVEHLGRGTADAVDAMLIVVEPTGRSLETAGRIRTLAGDLGIRRLFVVANKVAGDEDRELVAARAPAPVLEMLPVDRGVLAADRAGRAVGDCAPALAGATERLVAALEVELQRRP